MNFVFKKFHILNTIYYILYTYLDSDILILIAFLLLSAFFSASETAFVTLSYPQVRAMVKQKKPFAVTVEKLKKNPHTLLFTILVGSNLVNTFTSVYATLVFSKVFGSNALGIITGLLTLLFLIFSEIIPKSIASKYARSISLVFSPLLYIFYYLFYPAVIILDLMIKLLFKVTGKPKTNEGEISEEELRAMISITAEHGSIPKHEKELMHKVLEFDETPVEQVMTSRTDIEALEASITVEEAAKAYLNHFHSRIPVYKETIDNIIGILSVQELFESAYDDNKQKIPISELELIKPIFVPESQKVDTVFRSMQKKHMHMAIVVDEHGGVSGFVTLEDLLEEIVGEIIDEHDEEESEIKQLNKNTWLIEGATNIDDINQKLMIELKAPEHKNLSYFILNHLNRFPQKGELINIGQLQFEVESMKKRSIDKIKVTKKK